MNKSRLLGAVCALTFFNATTAARTLDQSFDPTSSGVTGIVESGVGVYDDYYIDTAQTFTVGITGQLMGVDIYTYQPVSDHPVELLLDIRPTINGVPDNNDENILASVLIPSANIDWRESFVNVDLSSLNLAVVQNDLLAIVLSARDDAPGNLTAYYWLGAGDGNPGGADYYTGGSAFLRTGHPLDWTEWAHDSGLTPIDMGFKTYVSTVPIPASVWLFGSGLLGLIGLTRRKAYVSAYHC